MKLTASTSITNTTPNANTDRIETSTILPPQVEQMVKKYSDILHNATVKPSKAQTPDA
jgi:hypothetical protein